ncbi:MAG: hypothetical protein KDB23_28535, partial [Planctomycetales bacterium]|nr:hypothetical protein [Planctomycetales bacterium]
MASSILLTSRSKRRQSHRRSGLEQLEDRQLLAGVPELAADLMQRDLTGSQPHLYTQLGDETYFIAETGATGSELWRTDGTYDGTQLVKTIAPPQAGWSGELVNIGDTLYFNGYDADAGWELWKSDGTTAGTQRVVDLVPGPDSGSPHVITEVNGRIYFGTTNEAASEAELWLTDGTSAGTTQVYSWPYTNRIKTILAANGTAFVQPDFYQQLWTTNGTPEGTIALSHELSFSTLRSYNTSIAALNDYVFFVDTQRTVWRTDGTEAGTTVFYQDNELFDLARIGNKLYIATYHGVLASEETPESIRTVVDDSLEPRTLYFFLGGDNQLALIRSLTTLWSSDGTPEGTVVIDSPEFRDSGIDKPLQAVRVGDHVYYYRYSPERALLGVTDGTAAGTYQVDARPHPIRIDSRLAEAGRLMGKVGGKLIFTSYDEQDGAELWISDGSDAGTHLLRDLAPGNSGSDPAELLAWNDQLFIGGTTLGGIQRLGGDNSPFAAPYASLGPQSVVVTNEAVFFTDNDGELWRTDGTQVGTKQVTLFGMASQQPRPVPEAAVLVAHGNDIYFTANDANAASAQGPTGVELWRSDGTAEGTVQVSDIAPGSRSSVPYDLTFVGDTLFFGVLEGGELWKSDGTAAGTMLVKDVRPGV